MVVVCLGIILVCSHPARVLFDSRASMCIIAQRFVEQHSFPTYPLPMQWNIITGNGVVTAHQGCRSCQLVISGLELVADFIVHDIRNYDVVLGMDWLASFYANIDCFSKKVVFRVPGHPVFEFKSGSTSSGPVKFRAVPLQEQPAVQEAVMYMEVDRPAVVREFDDVFPDEIPGLPPDRAVEFSIDLIPG